MYPLSTLAVSLLGNIKVNLGIALAEDNRHSTWFLFACVAKTEDSLVKVLKAE